MIVRGGITLEQYHIMLEQGINIPEEEKPIDPFADFDCHVQQAYFIYNILPDKIDSMGGLWLGKDFSGIGDILNIYNILDKRSVMDYLIYMIQATKEQYAIKRDSTPKQ